MQSFDPAAAQFVTLSARVYRIKGRPGLDSDAAYVWARWKRIAKVAEQRDVTHEVLAAIEGAKDGDGSGVAD